MQEGSTVRCSGLEQGCCNLLAVAIGVENSQPFKRKGVSPALADRWWAAVFAGRDQVPCGARATPKRANRAGEGAWLHALESGLPSRTRRAAAEFRH